MAFYNSNKEKLAGSNYGEVKKNALIVYSQIKAKTKRRPYLRSVYFEKQKVFFDHFWTHLYQKSPKERFKRLKYFEAAIDLIKNTKDHPFTKQNPNRRSEIFHRFNGLTKEKESFCVQIKEDKRNGEKYFMSCFPSKTK